MANLSSIVRGNKQLNQVANQLKNVALFYAPKKTGNLKRRLNSENKPSNMIKIVNGQSKSMVTISLNLSPNGAEYGKWWNSPTISRTVRNGKTKNVPRSIDFGKQAMEDPSVKREWSQFFKEFSDEYVKAIVKELKS